MYGKIEKDLYSANLGCNPEQKITIFSGTKSNLFQT